MTQRSSEGLVLIVDDTPANLGVLYSALAREQIEVVVAEDGAMALEVARSERPDVILLDVVMPGVDGFEVCRQLKGDERTRDIPVMFMTALGDTRDRLQGFQVGAVDYVTKPFQEGELLARVRTQLSLRQMTRALQEQNLRLEQQIREREAAEAARAALTGQLRETNARLEEELARRAEAEATRARLQEQIIAVQEARLRELSTPLIPITDRIVVMPLIGTLDAERVAHAMEVALQGAAARRAEFVILDVTGVQALDPDIADTLLRVGDGLRLLGARAVITGLQPAIASALVELQVSLGRTATRATLQDGIAYAMAASVKGAASHARRPGRGGGDERRR